MSLAAFRGLAGAMFAFAMVAGLGILMRPLLPIDETRYLAVAWEMRQSGNWIVPHLNGALYAQKPPLLFWLIDLEWALFGVSETGARLVGPLAGVAGLFLTGRLAGRLWPDDPALSGRAAWMLAGFSTWALYAGLTMFDALLGVAVLVGMSALVADRDGRFGWIGLGSALAFGVLAKGPVILVYLLPAALAMPFLRPERWTVSLRRIGLGLLLALGLVGLWLVPALVLGGAEYREAVLWTQSAGRVANAFDHARPFWFFAALLPLLLWPWLWSRQVWQGLIFARWRDDFGLGLAAVWALGTLGLFSLIASKQLHYMVPAFPAVALILARATPVDALRAPAAALLPAVLGFGLIALGLGWQPDADLGAVAGPPLALWASGLWLLAVAGAALRLRGGVPVALTALGLVVGINLVFLLGTPGRVYSSGPMAAAIAPSDAVGIGLVGEGYAGQFSFSARLTHPVIELADPAAAQDWLAEVPGRVALCRTDHACPEGAPARTISWRGSDYGLWKS